MRISGRHGAIIAATLALLIVAAAPGIIAPGSAQPSNTPSAPGPPHRHAAPAPAQAAPPAAPAAPVVPAQSAAAPPPPAPPPAPPVVAVVLTAPTEPQPPTAKPTKSERRRAHEEAVALAKKRKADRQQRHRAARLHRKASWQIRREIHDARHPNDRHPPPPAPLPEAEQIARAELNRLQRSLLVVSLGRGCPLCSVLVSAPTPWRRAEDGAHVCERCCEDLDSFTNVVTAEAAE